MNQDDQLIYKKNMDFLFQHLPIFFLHILVINIFTHYLIMRDQF